MKLKITGTSAERLESNLKNILSVATLVCLKGYIPSEQDIEEAETKGRWYIQDSETRYNLVPMANDYWANIKEKGEHFIVLEFNVRYDGNGKKKDSLSNLILSWFDYVELVA